MSIQSIRPGTHRGSRFAVIVSAIFALGTGFSATAITVDGNLSDFAAGDQITTYDTGGTPASSFIVYAYADTNWLYVGYQLAGATASAGTAINIGLDGGTPVVGGTTHNGAWSFAFEDWSDFTSDAAARCKYNDNGNESLQTRDQSLSNLATTYGSAVIQTGRSGSYGGQQIIEVAISMEVLADAFGRTYSNFSGSSVAANTVIILSGHYLDYYGAPTYWSPAYYGDGTSYAHAANYVPLTVKCANDSDGDGICDAVDTCPGIDNAANNADTNGDGIGNYCQCGDVNRDGLVNNIDSILIKRADLGLSTGGSYDPALCDVNGDGNCNNIDSILIKRADLGLSTGPSFKTMCAPTP